MEYTLDSFVEALLTEKNPSVSSEVRTQLKADLMDRAENMINAELLAHMPPSALADFEQMLDSGTEAEIQEFCRSHIENLDEVVASALMRLRALYMG